MIVSQFATQVVAYPKKVARITHSKSAHADGREQGGASMLKIITSDKNSYPTGIGFWGVGVGMDHFRDGKGEGGGSERHKGCKRRGWFWERPVEEFKR